uniref:Uncharacterized protein n=1 Tax=Davidia involucrata TaxID=16924 RepID=A0A5B7CA92_DAVIN
MFRALSTTRRSRHGYERLADEPSVGGGVLEGKLRRVTSLPAKVVLFGSSSKKVTVPAESNNFPAVKRASKIHPLFSLFDTRRRRKKTTAMPQIARYLEYVKEGGIWDMNSNMPVIYYK